MKQLCLLIISLCTLTANGNVVDEARKFCDARDYNAAVSVINEQISREGASSGLFYDLGVIYYKAGNHGAAALNFGKALRMDPSNSAAKNNSMVVAAEVQQLNESLTGDRNLDPAPQIPGVVERLSQFIVARGSNFWCIIAISVFIIGVAGIGLYLLVESVPLRKTGFFGGIGMIILAGLLFMSSISARRAQLSRDEAVIMVSQAQLKSQPDASAKDVAAPLSGGTIVKILSAKTAPDKTEWVYVFLNTDYSGWLRLSDIENISVAVMK